MYKSNDDHADNSNHKNDNVMTTATADDGIQTEPAAVVVESFPTFAQSIQLISTPSDNEEVSTVSHVPAVTQMIPSSSDHHHNNIQQQPHIRPTKLKRRTATGASSSVSETNVVFGSGSRTPPPITTTAPATAIADNSSGQTSLPSSSLASASTAAVVVQSILRKAPRYSHEKTTISPPTTTTNRTSIRIASSTAPDSTNHRYTDDNEDVTVFQQQPETCQPQPQPQPIQQLRVIEKPRNNNNRRTQRQQQQQQQQQRDNYNIHNVPIVANNDDIEGYVPRSKNIQVLSTANASRTTTTASTTTGSCHQPVSSSNSKHHAINDNHTNTPSEPSYMDDTDVAAPSLIRNIDNYHDTKNGNGDETDDQRPLVFNSLADLMEMAGTLPPTTGSDSTTTNHISPNTMIETQLDFTVIDPVDYEQAQNELFYGRTSLPQPGIVVENDGDGQNPIPIMNDNDNTDDTTTSGSTPTVDDRKGIDGVSRGRYNNLRERFPNNDGTDNDDQYSDATEERNALDSDEDEDDDDGDDDILMDALTRRRAKIENDDNHTPPKPPRAFISIWNAISQWVTPYAVEYIYQLRQNCSTAGSTTTITTTTTSVGHGDINSDDEQPPRQFMTPYQQPNDVALSRCHGLISIIQLQTSRCWREYMNVNQRYNTNHRSTIDRNNSNNNTQDAQLLLLQRQAEIRIASLLRCMDYSHPTPKFNMVQIRALTCILFDMVVLEPSFISSSTSGSSTSNDSFVPIPCQTLGMTYEEYKYLVQSSILSFRTD